MGLTNLHVPVQNKERPMLSSRNLAVVLTATACLSALATFALAQQEYAGATCAQANCANCIQALAVNYSSICPANTPNLCYSSSNVNSTAAVGGWCIQSARPNPPTCRRTDTQNQGTICGTMKYWNCGCITSGGVCNLCPCNPTNNTGTWTPNVWNGTCTNI